MKKLLTIVTMAILLTSCGKTTKLYYFDNEQPETNTCYIADQDIVCGETTFKVPSLNPELVIVCLDHSPTVDYPEVLLKVGTDYMAFLRSNTDGNHRLVKLPEGIQFQTTDGRDVLFSIEKGKIKCVTKE